MAFPNPVNETSARLVATGVVLMTASVAGLGATWVLLPLAYGFWARVIAGPTFSPLGQLVTRGITPRLPVRHRFVAGPPKRFAQGIGAALSSAALVAWLAGSAPAARVLAGMILVAAFLEAAFAYCLGCRIFAGLSRIGLVPAAVCEECNNLTLQRT